MKNLQISHFKGEILEVFPAARQGFHYNTCSQQSFEGVIEYNTRRKRLRVQNLKRKQNCPYL